jgi:hypothetical protein
MENKVCRVCLIEKPLSDFRNRNDSKDGKRNDCKNCQSEHNKLYNKSNAYKITIQRKSFYDENKERLLNDKKIKYEANRDIFIKRNAEYDKNKRQADPIYRFKKNVRTMIGKSLKKKSYTKKSQTFKIIGCLQDDFIKYIESKWESWMNWDNYGLFNGEPNFGWDIDHIRPMITGETEDEIIRLNHYTNLQPLCSYINRNIKRDSY